jgi:hypothetical protein
MTFRLILILLIFYSSSSWGMSSEVQNSTGVNTRHLYHSTPEKHLKSISKTGLNPNFGGENSGMSSLKRDRLFIDNSRGFVHATASLKTAVRYSAHRTSLLEKSDNAPLQREEYPTILRFPLNTNLVLQDDNDDLGAWSFKTRMIISPDGMQVLCTYDNDDVRYQGDNVTKFWLPIDLLTNHRNFILPIVPDVGEIPENIIEDTSDVYPVESCIQNLIRAYLKEKIRPNVRNGFNKLIVANILGTSRTTLNRYLDAPSRLRNDTRNRILQNFMTRLQDIRNLTRTENAPEV